MQRLNKLEVALYHTEYATENTRKRFYKCLNISVNCMIYIIYQINIYVYYYYYYYWKYAVEEI